MTLVLTNEEEDMLVGTGQPGRDRRMDTMKRMPVDDRRMPNGARAFHDTDAEATMGGLGLSALALLASSAQASMVAGVLVGCHDRGHAPHERRHPRCSRRRLIVVGKTLLGTGTRCLAA